jgi:hypothetical protein
MSDPVISVEQKINYILDIITDNPGITVIGIEEEITKTPEPFGLSNAMIRRYLTRLHRLGIIQKSGIHTHTYKQIKDDRYTNKRYQKLRKQGVSHDADN